MIGVHKKCMFEISLLPFVDYQPSTNGMHWAWTCPINFWSVFLDYMCVCVLLYAKAISVIGIVISVIETLQIASSAHDKTTFWSCSHRKIMWKTMNTKINVAVNQKQQQQQQQHLHPYNIRMKTGSEDGVVGLVNGWKQKEFCVEKHNHFYCVYQPA